MGNDESSLQVDAAGGSGSIGDSRRPVIGKSPVETLFRRLHANAMVPFDPDSDSAHMLILRQMWSCFNRGDSFKRVGEEWQTVGFQSPDPVTDFRATGLMGAKVTTRVLEKNKALVEYFLADIVVLESCLGNGAFYPLMANCVAIMVGICKLVGLAENSQSANVFKLRDVDVAVKEVTAYGMHVSGASKSVKSPRPSQSPTSAFSSATPSSPPSLHNPRDSFSADSTSCSASQKSSVADSLNSFFKTLGSAVKDFGTPAGVSSRRAMQLNSLFQDTRTFDLLLIHVMIQFHNQFMHDAIHRGATYMESSAILQQTLTDTATWLSSPMPVFERLRVMQRQQMHYNSDDYVSEYIADIMLKKNRSASVDAACVETAKTLHIANEEDVIDSGRTVVLRSSVTSTTTTSTASASIE
eukprot:INCI17677.1.p1 GENE.INCI17677.1~~INCI17677.1.p1  ORF type:complete len:412 (+),score=71.65 INCI17677.1:332-1567(+)